MTIHLRHAARAAGLTTEDVRVAESVLGHRHVLTRAVTKQHAVSVQAFVTVVVFLVAAVGVLVHVPLSPLVAGIGGVVALALLVVRGLVRCVTRDRANQLIAKGLDDVALDVVERERRRLSSPRERERLARSLVKLRSDAERWSRIHPRFRPLPGVVQLRHLSRELDDVVALLRAPQVRVRAVALTERLLTDGCSSPLYGDELEPLREELNRIRFLLAPVA
jgi:hypothetical protein